jgi:hypothetical protein
VRLIRDRRLSAPVAAGAHPLGRASAAVGAGTLAAIMVSALALLVYARTLLPGVSFGDWAEMQLVLPRLEVPHPSGFPLYVLLGHPFTLLPIESVAFRANLFSAVTGALAAGTAVLIAMRLGVRPSIAAPAALALAFTATLWVESTFAEMNALHLLLLGLLIHRVLAWRDERRDRDLLLAALLMGLSLSNHLLAATAIPFVGLFLVAGARNRLIRRPMLVAGMAAGFVLGLAPYLFIPVRALFGPPEQYDVLLTWEKFRALVTAQQYRTEMTLTSVDSFMTTLAAVPDVIAHIAAASHLVVIPLALVGAIVLLRHDLSLGLLLAVLAAANVHVYANYFGDLEHYLLLTWLIVLVAVAVAVEWLARGLVRRFGREMGGAEFALLLLPLAIMVGNWEAHDQRDNRLGEQFGRTVFAALPPDAVLVTYWDALTTLSYLHCIEGWRPDVALIALDPAARVTCDRVTGPLEEVARERPVLALFIHDGPIEHLRGTFDTVPGPAIRLPYGQRYPEFDRPIYRLVPRD